MCRRVLTTLEEKLKLFQQHGIEQVVVLDFNEQVASVTPDEFIGQFLVDSLQASGVVVGGRLPLRQPAPRLSSHLAPSWGAP